ncbi:hypothetical protein B7R22_07090 [Subtercola boreus]|uniref:DUF732 domain-containing protein n=1 Tax=Subtercola boreus TaxID=120213 RepID=A0A3E0VZC2_9MICO|nr:hypothetical protein [Subtercola boreus]RFA15090.1 hypothetical protein B7R22_07090 [Subtercola boreus]
MPVIHRSTIARLAVLGAVALASLGALSACSGDPGHPETTTEAPLSQSPVADALYRCITESGWEVTLTDDGGIDASSDTIPAEQYDRYLADTWACNQTVSARFPVDDRQKRLLYDAELRERDCLAAQGYAVADAPSLQAFLDGYESEPWSAMASSGVADRSQTMSDAEWQAINHACPQPVPGTLH